ncbi:MAG: DUF763 domain-containing protein [Candidatus Aenigmarchaeota archaeon]|nr:DUF763 domain-containing protein [Candidatus Aenigmarchaeota archaeon]MDI6722109.1 DUF763 domain-containing protein [Candidatus Aenigmarchaeota archaeon]
MRTADLPLHYGHAPSWLFRRMVKLAREMSVLIIDEYGEKEFLERLSNPFWFQGFGCVLGFDWHSSGVTTTVCGALKEAHLEDYGIAVCGGKKASKRTPLEIESKAEKLSVNSKATEDMKYASKMAAKVDSSCIQDGYNLYQHSIFFSKKHWAVVQQGMNVENRYARRYHWFNTPSFIFESEIVCNRRKEKVLNMASEKSKKSRQTSLDVLLDKEFERFSTQKTLLNFSLNMPSHHNIRKISKQTSEALRKAYEINPQNYEELVAIRGIGPAAIRALALISELVYGAEPSWEDPVKYSFSHGGKDGIPYPVDRKTYDESIEMLKNAIENAKLGDKEKIGVLKRLHEIAK